MSSLPTSTTKDGLITHRSDVYHPLAVKKVILSFKGETETFEVLRQYAILREIARGTFGFVALAEDTTMEQTDPPKEAGPNAPWNAVAIKKVRNLFSNPRLWLSAVRELKMLRFFQHPNIISARDVMIPLGDHNNLTLQGIEARTRNFDEVYLVMDFMDTTLKGLLADDDYCQLCTGKNPTLQMQGDQSARVSSDPKWTNVRPMGEQCRKYLLMQILQGLEYMHACGVVHRDLKPENVLVNSEWNAKVCDFGQGRGGLASEEDMVADVDFSEVGQCTQWYAAPEHLRFAFNLNQSNHGAVTKETMHADDVWAVGCIAAEMLIGKPIFDAKTPGGQGQLDSILNVLGLPSESDLASMQKWSPYPLCEHFNTSVAKHVTDCRVQAVLRAAVEAVPRSEETEPITVSDHEIELIAAMLRWDPSKRITIKEALQSPLFSELEESRVKLEDFPVRVFPKVDKNALQDPSAARKIIWDIFTECHPEVLELQEALRGQDSRRDSPAAESPLLAGMQTVSSLTPATEQQQ